MTEAEWLAGTNFTRMMLHVNDLPGVMRRKAHRRKMLLFACAGLRLRWRLLTDGRLRGAVETAEQLADGEAGVTARDAAHGRVWEFIRDNDAGRRPEDRPLLELSQRVAQLLDSKVGNFAWAGIGDRGAAQVQLLREVVGNPFRPVSVPAAVRAPLLRSLAQAAYDERSPADGTLATDRLAVLADALEEAGAPDELVTHLRGPGPHVRGCWALDLVLGLS